MLDNLPNAGPPSAAIDSHIRRIMIGRIIWMTRGKEKSLRIHLYNISACKKLVALYTLLSSSTATFAIIIPHQQAGYNMNRTMKQIILGSGVLTILVAYSLWVRHELPVIAPPATLRSSPSASAKNATQGAGTTTAGSQSNTSVTYKDGTFVGSAADAYYGNVQVKATIRGGSITDVAFVQYPNTHDTSVMINQQAMPYLRQEALQSQNANVSIISGATFTSEAFIQSLASALNQAKA